MSQQKQTIKLEFPRVANSIDLPIGTTFNIGKVQYQVVPLCKANSANPCEGCMMSTEYCHYLKCISIGRADHKEVTFTITNLKDQL